MGDLKTGPAPAETRNDPSTLSIQSARSPGSSALQGAASVAGLLITTEAMIAEAPKKEAVPAIPGGGGMGMGGMGGRATPP